MTSSLKRNHRAALRLAAIAALALLSVHGHAQSAKSPGRTIWTVPEVGALPDNDYGRVVRHGRDLITATYAHIGPEVSDPAKRYAGNNLACGNCHLEAGTKNSVCRSLVSTATFRNTAREPAPRSASKIG